MFIFLSSLDILINIMLINDVLTDTLVQVPHADSVVPASSPLSLSYPPLEHSFPIWSNRENRDIGWNEDNI